MIYAKFKLLQISSQYYDFNIFLRGRYISKKNCNFILAILFSPWYRYYHVLLMINYVYRNAKYLASSFTLKCVCSSSESCL